ncbi:hypothetical protein RAS12_30335 (plasmid) [Achromobacter seleniivolatilans]|uniref:Uncharacterized protein n=1 Tax=Achromobacter seleniivolatilans TaxID=3047478 RepID=A0ABY9MAB3_9BURK|nr:hypothetical protein [Achromobacter sp. R39]WMD23933.1 hypothetical protein RAS12_30335 [Achromobacter sp. R39]
MKAIAFPSSIQAAAFLDGIQYVNDDALTPLGIKQYPNGTAEALLQDTDDAEDDSGCMAIPVSDRELSQNCSIPQPPAADGDPVLLTQKHQIRDAFERGYQTVLGESQAQSQDARCPFFHAGKTAAWRELVEGGGREAFNSSDEYWLEFLEQWVLAAHLLRG